MFGRKKAKAGKLPKISTVIGKGTEIKGDIHFEGGLHVDGKVVGSIYAEDDDKNTLVLSELGYIEGDVHVANVVLNGEVHGDVHASNRVELANKASINGTVYYKFLEMMMGAEVNGQLIRSDEEPVSQLTAAGEKTDSPTELKRLFSKEDSSAPAAPKAVKGVEQQQVQAVAAGQKQATDS